MKIFDGVELKQAPGSGVQNWLSVAMLIANSFLEAEKCRQERIAGGSGSSSGTLDEVMAQAGLKIPALEDALVQLMGGGEEAKQTAAMIARAPDPGKLLQQFARQMGFGAANTGPVVTPPPGVRPAVAAAVEPPNFRSEFTREARQAARAAVGDTAGDAPAFRPEFTREARQAAVATASAAPTMRPDVNHDARPAAAASETVKPSLVSLVERQLAALRQRMKAHEEAIDARLKRAESELAAMREELEMRSRPTLAVVPVESCDADDPAVESEVTTPAPQLADVTPVAVSVEVVAEPVTVELPHELTPESGATEDEVVQAVGLISAFAEEVEERHQQGLARVDAVEREVEVLRSRIAAQPAASHG